MRLAGEAHRQAELAQLASEQKALEEKQKQINNLLLQRQRGQAAQARERQLQLEKCQLEEQIKQIDRKKRVFLEESNIAHERAKQFR